MKYREIIDNMKLEDKIALCSGADFWHTKAMEKYKIPEMMMCDGPHGLRKQEDSADMLGINESVPATSFPTAAATGCSWDPELLGKIGAAIAKEAASNNVGVVLGPGVNLKRNPLCGRNFEYLSEDPYLSGKLGARYISEAQKEGVGTSLKHFACNNQELKRFSSDSILDERTLRELYLTPFEIAVKEGNPATVMCAYNKINGTFCSDNKQLLNHILRKEWGFEGMVLTDWGAMHDRIKGFQAGCDLMMPGGSDYMEKEVIEAVHAGELREALIDLSVERILDTVLHANDGLKFKQEYSVEEHHSLARMASEQSAVLLKNEEELLPLKKEQKIGLIGSMAKKIRYQGAGSSHINPTKLVNVTDVLPGIPFEEGCDADGETSQSMLEKARILAKQVDVPIVFAGLTDRYESEGFDRKNMKLPDGHNQLISAVAGVNPNTVVVLMSGSVVELPWLNQVKAVLYMALPGQAGGEAIVNLLYGNAVPCGKLAETWPSSYKDCISSTYYDKKDAHYREGIYMGYRYYDKANIPVRFPFGFGLSYTRFEYSEIELTETSAQGEHQYKVTCCVTNIGKVQGAEIVQLYVSAPQNGVFRPDRELRGFSKLFLQPGETKKAEFYLDQRSFAIWKEGWRVQDGNYRIQIASSSREIRLETEIYVPGEKMKLEEWQKHSWYATLRGIPSKKEWERILGYEVKEKPLKKGDFTMENTVMEMKEYSFIIKIMYKAVEKKVAQGFGKKVDYEDPDFRMIMASSADSSLSAMKISGGMKNYVLEGMLEMANGHYLRGIKTMMKK